MVTRIFYLASTISAFVLLLPQCTTVEKRVAVDSKQNEKIAAYLQFGELYKTDPLASCQGFSSLASDSSFVLSKFAYLKSYQVCPIEHIREPLDTQRFAAEPWMEKMTSETLLTYAENSKNPEGQIEALIANSKFETRNREKVNLVLRAKTLLKELKNQGPAQKLQVLAQERLELIAPRFIKSPKPEELIRVANDLIQDRQFGAARKLLARARKHKRLSANERINAFKIYRQSYKIELDRENHIFAAQQYAQAVLTTKDAQKINEAYVTLARALWTEGNGAQAQLVLKKAHQLITAKFSTEEIDWIRGRMAEEREDFELALNYFLQAEKASQPLSAFRSKILFSRAWTLRKLKRFDEAAEIFKYLSIESVEPSEIFRSHFWQAKSLANTGKLKEAESVFETLISEDPLGFYSMLASRELKRPLPLLKQSYQADRFDMIPHSVSPSDHFYMDSLIKAKEYSAAEFFINERVKSIKESERAGSLEFLYYLKSYARAGIYLPLFSNINKYPPELRQRILTQYSDLIFPRLNYDLIKLWGTRFNVAPEFVLSIIRQESAFNPQARSPVDAFGLMQILPKAAKSQVPATGIDFDHFESLYLPETNIPLGISLLAGIAKKYENQFLLTAASYNANDKAIKNWLNMRLKSDPIEFIEDIPYEETRSYVKLVLRNFIMYNRLNQPESPIEFPEWCLMGLHQARDLTARQ